jgi:hypothetical protein
MIVSSRHQSESCRGEYYQLLHPIYPGDFVKITTMAFLSAIAVFSPIVLLQPASAANIRADSVSCVTGSGIDSNRGCETKNDYSTNYNPSNPFTPYSGSLQSSILSTGSSFYGATARGSVDASAGTLKASAFSQMGSRPENIAFFEVQSHSSANVYDFFDVTSSTLSDGDPVTLLFTLSVDGALLYSPAGQSFGAQSASAVTYFVAGQNSAVNLRFSSDSLPLDSRFASNQINRFLTGTFTTAVGRRVDMSYAIDVSTYTRLPGSVVQSDFGHTSRFFVDSQTAGVVLRSSSGHNYASPAATPVPTPALLPGLIALSAALRRQHHKVCA